jgi:hypothetical protein
MFYNHWLININYYFINCDCTKTYKYITLILINIYYKSLNLIKKNEIYFSEMASPKLKGYPSYFMIIIQH